MVRGSWTRTSLIPCIHSRMPVVILEGYGDSCLLIHATHKHLNQLRFPVLDLVCGGVERQLVVGAPLDASLGRHLDPRGRREARRLGHRYFIVVQVKLALARVPLALARRQQPRPSVGAKSRQVWVPQPGPASAASPATAQPAAEETRPWAVTRGRRRGGGCGS